MKVFLKSIKHAKGLGASVGEEGNLHRNCG